MSKYGSGYGRGRLLETLNYCPFHRFEKPSTCGSAERNHSQQISEQNGISRIGDEKTTDDRFRVTEPFSGTHTTRTGGGFANSNTSYWDNYTKNEQHSVTSFGQINARVKFPTEEPSIYANPCEKVTVECSQYEECDEVKEMTEQAANELRKQKQIVKVVDLAEADIKSQRFVPKPIWKFEHAFGTNETLMKLLVEKGFDKPTPIQCQMWPIILSGYDCIGIAQTGTGKTLAFLLPAFVHMDAQKIRCSPAVLVLTPTRELACQVEKEAKKFSYNGYRTMCFYGGLDRDAQINRCRGGMDIAIATPGRLNDLIRTKIVNLQGVSYLVLDEADRMLDMGFRPQIEKIVGLTCKNRMTVLTSATWPESVRDLAREYTKSAMQIVVGSLKLNACENVKQDVRIASRIVEKMDYLLEEISKMSEKSAMLVFANRKRDVDSIQVRLMQQSVSCAAMHGGRDQLEREDALRALRTGKIKVLVATDVASRGIDLPNITHVFNFDFPTTLEEYVHRIGRTGRAGRTGSSVTLLAKWEDYRAAALIEILEKNSQNVPTELRHLADCFIVKQQQMGNDSGEIPGITASKCLPCTAETYLEADFYSQKKPTEAEKMHSFFVEAAGKTFA